MAAANIKLNPLAICILIVTSLLLIGYMRGFSRKPKSDKVDLKQLLSVSIISAQRGGDEIRAVHERHKLNEIVKGETREGAKEMLTDGDLNSQAAMTYGLHLLYPDIKIVAEEKEQISAHSMPLPNEILPELHSITSKEVKVDEVAIWIDPLDATQEFTENLLQYVTTMVCIAVKGTPVIGVIHRPFENETIWGFVGHGYSSNLHPADSTKKGIAQRIIVSRSHAGEVESKAKQSFGPDTIIIPAGGSGYKTLQVIKGEADAYVHVTLIKKWDICAGDAILRAVNGRMTTLDGHEIDYAASGSVANEYGLVASLRNQDDFVRQLGKIQN